MSSEEVRSRNPFVGIGCFLFARVDVQIEKGNRAEQLVLCRTAMEFICVCICSSRFTDPCPACIFHMYTLLEMRPKGCISPFFFQGSSVWFFCLSIRPYPCVCVRGGHSERKGRLGGCVRVAAAFPVLVTFSNVAVSGGLWCLIDGFDLSIVGYSVQRPVHQPTKTVVIRTAVMGLQAEGGNAARRRPSIPLIRCKFSALYASCISKR